MGRWEETAAPPTMAGTGAPPPPVRASKRAWYAVPAPGPAPGPWAWWWLGDTVMWNTRRLLEVLLPAVGGDTCLDAVEAEEAAVE